MGTLPAFAIAKSEGKGMDFYVERRGGYPGISHPIEVDSTKMYVDRTGMVYALQNHPYSKDWDMNKVKLVILKNGQVILTHDGVEHPTEFMELDDGPYGNAGFPPGWTIFTNVRLKFGHATFGYRILNNKLVAHATHHGSSFLQRGNICGIVRAWLKFMGV